MSPSVLNDILSPLNVSKELSEKSSGSSPYNFSVENADRRYLRDPSHPDYKELNPLDIKSRTDAEVGNKTEYENAIVKNQEGRLDLEEMKPGVIKRTIKTFLDSKSEKVLENREYAMEQIHARRNDNDVISDPIISKAEETNVAASSLLDQLNTVENKPIKDIISTPIIANVGLQTPIADRLNPSPIENKPSLSNLLDNFKDFYDDTGIDIDDNTNIHQGESSKTKIEDKPIKQDLFSNLLQQIKSKRKEYGTPLNSDKDLSSESESSEESEESSKNKAEVEISPIN
jgi:hypothetical protein